MLINEKKELMKVIDHLIKIFKNSSIRKFYGSTSPTLCIQYCLSSFSGLLRPTERASLRAASVTWVGQRSIKLWRINLLMNNQSKWGKISKQVHFYLMHAMFKQMQIAENHINFSPYLFSYFCPSSISCCNLFVEKTKIEPKISEITADWHVDSCSTYLRFSCN